MLLGSGSGRTSGGRTHQTTGHQSGTSAHGGTTATATQRRTRSGT
jgi:hypothetical protein